MKTYTVRMRMTVIRECVVEAKDVEEARAKVVGKVEEHDDDR